MTALATLNPIPQYFDLDGSPLDGGKLYFGVVNANPETSPITVYWDAAGTQPAAQPVRTLNGFPVRSGSPAVIYADVDYSLTVRDKKGRLVLYAKSSADFGNASTIQAAIDALSASIDKRFAEYVNITDPAFGAVSGQDAAAAMQAASDYCTSKDIPGDAGGPYGGVCLVIPDGTFPISVDVQMPRNVLCYGQVTGAGTMKFTQLKRGWLRGLRALNVLIDGLWFSRWSDCYIAALTIKGGGVGFGTFWNIFENIQAAITIDLSNWSVNQNRFSGRGNFTTIGSGALVLDGHGNNTDLWDFTGGQCSNTASVQQTSLLVGAYYEAGADIAGDYHILGFQGDAQGPPRIGRANHALGSYNVVEKNRADFLGGSESNLLPGGSWDYLDTTGKPVCLVGLGGALAVSADTTEPFGMRAKYGGNFTVAFTGFSITLPACRSGRFSLTLAFQGPDFASVQVARGGGGSTTFGGHSIVTIDAVNNWKLLRLSGNASTTAATVISFFALTAAGAATINVGGMYATQEKIALLPSPKAVRRQEGEVTQGYVAAPPFVDVAIVFPRAFSAAPKVTACIADSGQPQVPNFTKVIVRSITAAGFTARVYYSVDWTGIVSWSAVGLD